MAVSAISDLSAWLDQVNGSKSQNLNAAGSSTQTFTQTAAQTVAQGPTQGVQGHARRGHAHGPGGTSNDQQTALNQLLQELKLGSSSTTATAAATAGSAQSTGTQQLMSLLQRLAQGGSSTVGGIISALV